MPFLPPHSPLAMTNAAVAGLQLGLSDTDLLHKWMNEPRVNEFWGTAGPQNVQDEFLRTALKSKHSFPVIGCWDGKPFGYFEIYWVKEDVLGKYAINVGNYDRGLHILIGEDKFRQAANRGKERCMCPSFQYLPHSDLKDQ